MTWLMTSHDPYGHAPMDMCMHPQHPGGWPCNSFDINKKCKNYPYPLRPWGRSKMHYKCRHRISPGPWDGKQSGLTRQNCTVNKFQALNATNSNHHTNILHTKLESPEKLKIVPALHFQSMSFTNLTWNQTWSKQNIFGYILWPRTKVRRFTNCTYSSWGASNTASVQQPRSCPHQSDTPCFKFPYQPRVRTCL